MRDIWDLKRCIVRILVLFEISLRTSQCLIFSINPIPSFTWGVDLPFSLSGKHIHMYVFKKTIYMKHIYYFIFIYCMSIFKIIILIDACNFNITGIN